MPTRDEDPGRARVSSGPALPVVKAAPPNTEPSPPKSDAAPAVEEGRVFVPLGKYIISLKLDEGYTALPRQEGKRSTGMYFVKGSSSRIVVSARPFPLSGPPEQFMKLYMGGRLDTTGTPEIVTQRFPGGEFPGLLSALWMEGGPDRTGKGGFTYNLHRMAIVGSGKETVLVTITGEGNVKKPLAGDRAGAAVLKSFGPSVTSAEFEDRIPAGAVVYGPPPKTTFGASVDEVTQVPMKHSNVLVNLPSGWSEKRRTEFPGGVVVRLTDGHEILAIKTEKNPGPAFDICSFELSLIQQRATRDGHTVSKIERNPPKPGGNIASVLCTLSHPETGESEVGVVAIKTGDYVVLATYENGTGGREKARDLINSIKLDENQRGN